MLVSFANIERISNMGNSSLKLFEETKGFVGSSALNQRTSFKSLSWAFPYASIACRQIKTHIREFTINFP